MKYMCCTLKQQFDPNCPSLSDIKKIVIPTFTPPVKVKYIANGHYA